MSYRLGSVYEDHLTTKALDLNMSSETENTRSVPDNFLRQKISPAYFVFMSLFMILSFVGLFAAANGAIDVAAISEAAPLAVSGVVFGFFSVLFWALNYVSRERKVSLRVEEATALFALRRQAIDDVLPDDLSPNKTELAISKAHLLMAISEVPEDPEVPGESYSFDYSAAVKNALRK